MKTRLITFALSVMIVLSSIEFSNAQPSISQDSAWVTNGTVYAISYQKGIAYIGGNFSYVGPNRPYGAVVSPTTGETNLLFPKVNGIVYTAASDGSGGWYIGGDFTSVGGVTRNRIAYIKSDGTVDPNFNPNANSTVLAIAVSGSTLYVGGDFSSIGGQSRSRLAALDATTGNAKSWNPSPYYGVVRAIAISGSTVYVGGGFSSIGGQTRNRIAAIDVSTGSVTSWNPNITGGTGTHPEYSDVITIISDGLTVYVGGGFGSVGGQVRNYLAAIDATTGTPTSWNPNPNNSIRTLFLSGSTVYAGGDFTTIGGQVRNNIAAIDKSSGTVSSWNPNANGAVRSIVVSGTTAYIGGDFSSIGGQVRGKLAALDISTGNATSWISHAIDKVRALSISGTNLFAGGDFRSVGGQYRSNLAAIDAVTGKATSWYPQANGKIWEIAASGSTVYIGGEFTTINGTTRNYIASVDAINGTLNSWNPNADGYVYAITVSGSTIYVGGEFRNIGGQPRNRLSAIDASTGNATGWNPNVSSGYWVTTIAVSDATVYVGGYFYTIGGVSRNSLAAIDATTGAVTNWNPNPSSGYSIYGIVLSGSLAYVGGSFTSIGGQTRNRLAAVDLSTSASTGWNPNANGYVYALSKSGSNVYAAGQFTNVGGYTRNYFVAIDSSTGIPTGWSPEASDACHGPDYTYGRAVTATGDVVFTGGDVKMMLNSPQDYFAQFGTVPANPVPSITSVSPSTVNRLQTLNVTLTGSGFISGITSISFGSDITINSVTVNSSTQLVANITVAVSASTGARTISATNDTPGGGTGSLPNGLTINNPAPTLTGISPTTANRLQTLNVVFTGTNFISGVTTVNVGSGITVNSTTVNSSTSITANITISASAATGSRNLSVTNSTPGGGTSGNRSFTINNPSPTISSAFPASGNRLQTLNVTVSGSNFISGTTSVGFGDSIVVNSTTVNSSTQVTVNITIAAKAATGLRNILVTNPTPGGGSATLQNAFTVNNPTPTLTNLTPSSGVRSESLSITLSGSNILGGLTTAGFGAGITVDSLIVISSSQAVAYLRIGSSALPGLRSVTITNPSPGGGTATLSNAFTVIGSAINFSSAAINFGKVKVGRLKDTTITITNTGNDTLRIASIINSDTSFVSKLSSVNVFQSQSIQDTIIFAPTIIGQYSGNFLIHSDAASSPDTIKVSGFGFGIPAMQFNTKAISFGSVKVGTFKDTTVTITNTGNDTLKITNIVSPRSTFTARPTIKNIPPGQSLNDTLRFAPITVGADSALLVIQSNSESTLDTIKVTGVAIPTTGVKELAELPAIFSLSQNYPNPFNPSTTIKYGLPARSTVRLVIYNMLGQVVKELLNAEQQAGYQSVVWNANVSSGLYFYRIEATSLENPNKRFVETKKILLLR